MFTSEAVSGLLEKLAYKNADLLLTVSEIEKKRLVSAGFQNSNIKIVPNGVDTEYFRRSSEKSEIQRKYSLNLTCYLSGRAGKCIAVCPSSPGIACRISYEVRR